MYKSTTTTRLSSGLLSPCLSEKALPVSYHVVTAECLHHRGFVQELDSLSQARWLIDCLDGHLRLQVPFDDVLGNSLVHHAEGALPKLSEQRDLFPWNLPLIRNINCTKATTVTATWPQIMLAWCLRRWASYCHWRWGTQGWRRRSEVLLGLRSACSTTTGRT